MTDPTPTLGDAEEWARWAALHDDWDKTRVLMGVLLAEYDRRGVLIAELESDRHLNWRRLARQLRDNYDELEAELAAAQAVVEAARAVTNYYRHADVPPMPESFAHHLDVLAARVRAHTDTTTEKG